MTDAAARAAAGVTAIVLAGGRSSRFGDDKAVALLDGRMLLQRVVDAVRGAGIHVVVVGARRPIADDDHVEWRQESPPFAGPVAGIAAGLSAVDSAETLVLACDLQQPEGVLDALLGWPFDEGDALVLTASDGREQWLATRFRTPALRRAIADVEADGGVRDAPVRAIMRRLAYTRAPVDADLVADVDTRADLDEAGTSARRARGTEEKWPRHRDT